MKQLTPQEAALYFGQDCLYTNPPYLPVSCKVDEQALYELQMGVPCEYQLLLRPLSDMTEEEESVLDSELWSYGSKHGVYSPEQFAYLLSKGLDLFGFIEQGKALDKTKLQP